MADRPGHGWLVRISLGLIGLGLAAVPPAQADGGPAPTIPMASRVGEELLLARGTRRADFVPLVQWYETQSNLAYCGVASSVMVLNSLGVAAPRAEGYGPNRFWTQTNLFALPASSAFVQASRVAREGMTLEQLHGLLASTGLTVRRYHGETLGLDQLRWLLQHGLGDRSDRLLANYDRKALGQAGGGHISPLAAYDPHRDRVLILDVARYRYPAVWVTIPDLWRAIQSIDSSSGRSRGLLSIEPGPPVQDSSTRPPN
jgi:hypothetical protein